MTGPSLVAVKDYRLCRRNSDEDLFTNEENGIILDSQWIGHQLRVDNILYIAINRLTGEFLKKK